MSGVKGEAEGRFDALYRDYAPRVLGYALRRVDPASAEDVVADAFAVAWRRIDEIPLGAELPWLLSVAHRTVANHLRGQRRRHALATRAYREPGWWPAASSEQPADDERALLVALTQLSPRDREILLLIAWDELTYREAAAVVGCTVTALRVRFHRARGRLARLLDASSARGSVAGTTAMKFTEAKEIAK